VEPLMIKSLVAIECVVVVVCWSSYLVRQERVVWSRFFFFFVNAWVR
jgi:hypothetical protein